MVAGGAFLPPVFGLNLFRFVSFASLYSYLGQSTLFSPRVDGAVYLFLLFLVPTCCQFPANFPILNSVFHFDFLVVFHPADSIYVSMLLSDVLILSYIRRFRHQCIYDLCQDPLTHSATYFIYKIPSLFNCSIHSVLPCFYRWWWWGPFLPPAFDLNLFRFFFCRIVLLFVPIRCIFS